MVTAPARSPITDPSPIQDERARSSTDAGSAAASAPPAPRGPTGAPAEYPAPRPLKALALILLASLSFASLSAGIKAIAPEVGLAPPIFARGLIGLVFCAVWLRARRVSLRPVGVGMLTLRCTAGGAAMLCYYWALTPGGGSTDLPTAVMLLKTAPLWVALLSPLVVDERPGPRIWIALAVGLCGLAVRYGFSLQGERWGVLAALVAGLLSALAYLALRALARTDDPLRVVTVFSAFLTLAPLPFLGAALDSYGGWTSREWSLLVLIGVLGTVGQLFLTSAYRYASAAGVTIAGLAEVGMATVFSLVWFAEVPPAAAFVGGALALAGGVIATLDRPKRAPAGVGAGEAGPAPPEAGEERT